MSTSVSLRAGIQPSDTQVLMGSLMMSGPNACNLNPLDCQVWGNAGVLIKAATEAKTRSGVLK